MAIFQRKSGIWVVAYYPEGKHGKYLRQPLPPDIKTEAEAKEYEKRFREQAPYAEPAPASGI